LHLPTLYSSILSVCIAFLSPQLSRFGGHFSLSYVFVIPLIIYLLIRFYRNSSITLTFIIGLVTFLAATTHLYFMAFYSLLLLFFWLSLIFSEKKEFGKPKFYLPHIFLQLVLPFLLLQIIFLFIDNVSDRTSSPWGYLYYRAYPESIFLPVGKPYGKFLDRIMSFKHIDWEGYAYIGLVAVIGFFFILKHVFSNLFHGRYKMIFSVTDNKLLNIFFWASFVGLLYSFGLPFILKLEFLIDYIGPLRQMRGIARFSWIFFYVMNIVSFYILWQWVKKQKKHFFKYLMLIISLGFICYDAWLNSKSQEFYLDNKIPVLDDWENKLPENKWVKDIDPCAYQAIIPIPYFHIGSENYWIESKCDIAKYCFIVSLKTGLPTTGVMLGRTSISQSVKTIQLFLEPYKEIEIIDDFPNEKPFLLLVGNCDEQNQNEKNLVNMSNNLFTTDNFAIYELGFEKLKHLSDSLYFKYFEKMNAEKKLFEFGSLFCTDSLENFIYRSFDDKYSTGYYSGNGAYEGNMKDYNVIFEGNIPNYKTEGDYVASFWFGNATKDIFPRTTMEILFLDSLDNIYKYDYQNVGKFYSIIDKNWALVEYSFRLNNPSDKLKLTLWNWNLKKEKILIDELLIRPFSNDIYRRFPGKLARNDRYYLKY